MPKLSRSTFGPANVFKNLLDQSCFFDCTLTSTDKKSIQGHKVIFSAFSPFLHKMLQKNEKFYSLPVEYKYLKDIVKFIYEGHVTLSEEEFEIFCMNLRILNFHFGSEIDKIVYGGEDVPSEQSGTVKDYFIDTKDATDKDEPMAVDLGLKKSEDEFVSTNFKLNKIKKHVKKNMGLAKNTVKVAPINLEEKTEMHWITSKNKTNLSHPDTIEYFSKFGDVNGFNFLHERGNYIQIAYYTMGEARKALGFLKNDDSVFEDAQYATNVNSKASSSKSETNQVGEDYSSIVIEEKIVEEKKEVDKGGPSIVMNRINKPENLVKRIENNQNAQKPKLKKRKGSNYRNKNMNHSQQIYKNNRQFGSPFVNKNKNFLKDNLFRSGPNTMNNSWTDNQNRFENNFSPDKYSNYFRKNNSSVQREMYLNPNQNFTIFDDERYSNSGY